MKGPSEGVRKGGKEEGMRGYRAKMKTHGETGRLKDGETKREKGRGGGEARERRKRKRVGGREGGSE